MESTIGPLLIQGSAAPIIKIDDGTGDKLTCSGCAESVLVEGYRPECLIGIGFECWRCKHVTWTPELPAGEVLHAHVVTLGATGRFLIGSTVTQSSRVTFTTDHQIARESGLASPRPPARSNLELSVEGLDAVGSELDLLSGGRFNSHLMSADRALARGVRYFRENPLAWALRYLNRQLVGGSLHMSDDTLMAIGIVQSYRNVFSRWRHHARAPFLAIEFCANFHHTIYQLIAASYLSDHGNRIAVNPPTQGGGRSADLYVRISAGERLHLEVKAPESLEWPNTLDSRFRMKKLVETMLARSRGQIGRSNPGVLIVGSSCISPGFFDRFGQAIRSTLRSKGDKYTRVAAIQLVGVDSLSLRPTRASTFDFQASYRSQAWKNPHYFQENPLATDVR